MKKDFITCGITGIFLEILYTSITNFPKSRRLIGYTSVLMFPIYGAAALFRPLSGMLKNTHFLFRGNVYMLCIFLAEFCSGKLLSLIKLCPWDYSKCKNNVQGLIRLDYAPLWFLTGLLYEQILVRSK